MCTTGVRTPGHWARSVLKVEGSEVDAGASAAPDALGQGPGGLHKTEGLVGHPTYGGSMDSP